MDEYEWNGYDRELMQRRRIERRRRRRKRRIRLLVVRLLLLAVLLGAFLVLRPLLHRSEKPVPAAAEPEVPAAPAAPDEPKPLSAAEKLAVIRSGSGYSENMIRFAEKYPQVIDFVYDYPRLRDERPEIDLTAEARGAKLPLLLQWDARWGYVPYGDGLIGYAGCGPVCLSMAALYLTGDAQWTPVRVAELAVENGYCVPGDGSSWTLISEGCELLGLAAEELPLVEGRMKDALDENRPVVMVVGPGDFTFSGHYLVLTGYNENGFTLNDPNSLENSAKSWSFDTLAPQICNLWALSKAS